MTVTPSRSARKTPAVGALLLSSTLAFAVVSSPSASATTTTINLATAGATSVLAGAGVTNTGPSTLNLDLDTSPTPAISGFPPGLVAGATHAADAPASLAQGDLTTAYNVAASAPSTNDETGVDLGGKTLTQGVYTASSAMSLTGPLPLTLNGTPSSVFIFQAGTTLITGSNSSVVLTGGMTACNVFWQVGSSATIGTTTSFIGNILALDSITLDTGATIQGRALARDGAVTLDSNVFSGPACTSPVTLTPTPTTTTTVAATTTTTAVATTTPTPVATTPTAAHQATPAAAATAARPPATPSPIQGPSRAVPARLPSGGGGGATLASSPAASQTLAATGLPLRPLLSGAALLIFAGTTIMWFGRRPRRTGG